MLGEPLTLLDLAGAATTFLGIVLVSSSMDASRLAGAAPVPARQRVE
jgi:drug/metabolite transporter (DMT)-like permease